MAEQSHLGAACSAASISAHEGARQSVNTFRALLANSTLQSGENPSSTGMDPCHSKVTRCSSLSRSQIFIVSLLSLAVATRFMSGEKAADQTANGNPVNLAFCFRVAVSQISTSLDHP